MAVVCLRESGFDPSVVVQPDVDPGVFAQPVRCLVAADAELLDIDQHMQRVEIVRSLLTDELIMQYVEAGEPVDSSAGGFDQLERRVQLLFTVPDHLPAPAVHAGVDQHVGAGRGQQVGTLLQPYRVHQLPLQVIDRTLFEAKAHFVHAHYADIGTGIHGPGGEGVVERQVRAPGFVNNQGLTAPVADLGNRLDVCAGSVRCRADDQARCRVGMALPHPLNRFGRRRVGQVQLVVPARADPARLQAQED